MFFVVELAETFRGPFWASGRWTASAVQQGHRLHAGGQGGSDRREGLVQVHWHVGEALARFRLGREAQTPGLGDRLLRWLTEAPRPATAAQTGRNPNG